MASIATWCFLLLPLAVATDLGLRDNPITADQVSYLDAPNWKVSGNGVSFLGSVPGDLITDLQRAGQIGDPLFGKNWLNSSIWENNNWTYSTSVDGAPSGMTRLLVFDGIKMGSTVSINGHNLFTATDQFLRYSVELNTQQHQLQATGNVLEVTFVSSIDVGGRFMACTGGWDWAPYSNTFQGKGGPHTLSKGIWKSVYTVDVREVAITHLTTQVLYSGSYPTEMLEDGTHGGFAVTIKPHLWAPHAVTGRIQLDTEWGEHLTQQVELPAGESSMEISVNASAHQIKLWWPTGLGEQPMYNITAGWVPSSANSPAFAATRRIGFRYAALVTGNDTDASFVAKAAGEEGTESHGMFFRVNGAAVWTRGANMIPMEEFEGRLSSAAHSQLVASAVDGGMNMLRVWGGGMFLPDAWYDACDRLGVLVYHDMQYAQQGHAPENSTAQELELRHQIRRLSAHPSIIAWDGCNECQVKMNTPTGIYASFVMTVVAQEDKSRSVWPSCPALGWTAGVNKLDALPNGNPLITPDSGTNIETHGPYQHGSGFAAVNGAAKLQPFDPNMPIKISPTDTGLGLQNVYASEFGAVVMSSFESMSATLAPEHWGLHAGQPADNCTGSFSSQCVGANVMAERNYPCDSLIDAYFGVKSDQYYNTTGEAVFKKQLYQCMLSQALNIKSNIETRRAQNQLGCLVWQYNEIWPTGGWGSIEYGTPVPGQVLGGRWKPLQYMYRQSIYQEVVAACGAGGVCYVKNDSPLPFKGRLTVYSLDFDSSETAQLGSASLDLPKGAGVSQFFQFDKLKQLNGNKSMVHAIITAPSGKTVSINPIVLAPPFMLELPAARVSFTVASKPSSDGTVAIAVSSDNTALFVTLTTRAHGRFSENSFLVNKQATRDIQFLPFGGPADIELLQSTLRVEHLQENL